MRFVVLAMIFGLVSSCDPALFNLFLNGDMTCSNSDVEGRLAVGGSVTLTNFAINCLTYQTGAALANHQCIEAGSVPCTGKNKNDEPGLVFMNGKFQNVNLYAGKAVYGSKYEASQAMKFGGSSCGISKNILYPASVKLSFIALKALSTFYNSYEPTGTTNVVSYSAGSAQITFSTLNRYAIFNVNAADLAIATDVKLDVPANAKLIFINVQGTTVSLKNFGMAAWKPFNAITMWNFPQATSISISSVGVQGSMLAPRADIQAGSAVLWGQIWAQSYTSIGSDPTCAQVNNVPFKGSFPPPPVPPPAGICGDGKTDVGEDCDGGACCSGTCKFLTSTTVCRPVAGSCDIQETCSGSSATCPNDVFKPVTEVCGSNFGVCDVQMFEHCPGDAATCKTAPPAYLWDWDAFNVVSFDKYTCFGGDVEGRLAVKNLLNVSGFTIGLKTVASDAFSYYELVVGDDAVYTDGSVHAPNGYPEIAIGGDFSAPDYLQAIRDLSPGSSVLGRFDEAQTYFTTISNKIASLGSNANAKLMYGDGLELTCASSTEALYIVKVDGVTFNQVNWYYTVGCKANAAWLITITGNNDITFRGGAFPGIVERVVYNIQGTRTISANNGVNGNIIAPQANYVQTQGVTYGKVIVGNVIEARQNNKPNCINFKGYTITQKNLVKVTAGDDFIYVFDLNSYVVGDSACIGGQCTAIVGGKIQEVEGKQVNVLLLASAIQNDVPEGSDVTTVVTDSSDAARSNTIPIENESSSSASVMVASVAFVAAALLL